jgi:hypothetical protein
VSAGALHSDALAHLVLGNASRIEDEPREDVGRNLKAELAPDLPGLGVDRGSEIHLPAHNHVNKLAG